jgi:hypothetical protein
MSTNRVADLTFEELRAIIRQEILQAGLQSAPVDAEDDVSLYGDLSDFPVDDLGPWPDDLTLNRDEFYDDDEQ